jgi:threonylcarbamoyladenosine tRNA methylthiotransferase MtaB
LYEFGLVNAVEAICGVEGIQRVRLGSLEPDMITESDIMRLSRLPKLCRHFHLSLQSGSNTVLERMNRRYTTDFYLNLVSVIDEFFYNVALTTDIITGFPGETDAEFEQTLEFVKRIGFAKIHVFPFSSREGTVAAEMSGQIPKAVKKERVSRLTELADTLRYEFFESLVGTEQDVLMEKGDLGHTSCYTPVNVKTTRFHEKNSIIKVKITGAESEFCIGEIIC